MIFRFAGRAYESIRGGDRLPLLALTILLSVFFESYFDVDLIWADYALNLLFLCVTVHGRVL